MSKTRVRVRRRRGARRSALGVIVAFYLGRTVLAAQASLEYQVKAAFLYNFVSFTAWPIAAFDAPSSPLRTCVLGGEALVTELERIVQGETVDGHPLVVERPLRPLELKRCHVLFIAREETARTADVIRDLGTAPVLTVGESDVFWRHGGIVNFVVDGGHVRFDINQRSAQQRRLVFSSKLLNVARRVQ